jgi:hypothetical protein
VVACSPKLSECEPPLGEEGGRLAAMRKLSFTALGNKK